MTLFLILCLLAGSPALQTPVKPPAARVLVTYRVPYRLTDSQHLLVRVKLNGKGPFNFIVDTGAPMIFVAKSVAKAAGIPSDSKQFGTVGRLDIEGGAALSEVLARIEDPMQLKSMNAIGLAGVKLDGILGYNVLARYRMEIDLTRSAMIWHYMDYSPPVPLRREEIADAEEVPPTAEMKQMERLVSMVTAMLTKNGAVTIRPRAAFGLELIEEKEGVRIGAVLPESAAAEAGAVAGDRIVSAAVGKTAPQPVKTIARLRALLANVPEGGVVLLTVRRSGGSKTLTLTGKAGL